MGNNLYICTMINKHTMKKTKKGMVAVRYNISEKAVDNVALFQASERVKGIKLTKEEACDFILSNFKIKE